MNGQEIIEMARQAGAHDNGYEVRFVEPKYLERFAKLVAAKEREACAKDVEAAYTLGLPYDDVATAIRARGEA
jgi:hypothetical protein